MSGNFAVDPPKPANPVFVCADAKRLGTFSFQVLCPTKAKNVEYPWFVKRASTNATLLDSVFNTKNGYSYRYSNLRQGEYYVLLQKKVDGKAVNFTRRIDFVIQSVELNIEGVAAKNKADPGAFIPLNAGNVNGSKTKFRIPEKYDFEVNPMTKASRLVKATFSVGQNENLAKYATGFRLRKVEKGRARIRVWNSALKEKEFTLPVTWGLRQLPAEIWIEGVKEGADLREIDLIFELMRGNEVLCADTTAITVTPVLTSLKALVTQGAVPGLTRHKQGPLLIGSEGGLPPNKDAFTLEATAVRQNLPGKLALVQIAHNTNNLGNNVGAILGADKFFYDFKEDDAGKWLMDATEDSFPLYNRPDNKGSAFSITERQFDSPAIVLRPPGKVLPENKQKTTIDVSLQFYTYAVWVYSENVMYFLGRTGPWTVRGHGTITVDPKSSLDYKFTPLKNQQGEVDNKNTGTIGFERLRTRQVGPANNIPIAKPTATEAEASFHPIRKR